MKFSDLCALQPKQLEAAEKVFNHTFTFYGGAAGGGKSFFLRWIMVALSLYYAKKYNIKGGRVGLFCEDYPALHDRHLSKIPFEFPKWLGSLNRGAHEFILDEKYGGWTIAFRNLDDPSKYLSAEFAAIGVDELTRNPRSMFDFLNMRRRWPGITDTKFISASNPGGIGHGWVRKLWIDRDFDGETFDIKDFAFIPAKATDNKYLGEAYNKQLEQLPEQLRKAYRDGDWNIFAGQFFTEWTEERNVCTPFQIPEGWSRIRCLDYGFEKPSACLWMAIDYDGKITVYRELYETRLTYSQLARKIKIMSGMEHIDYTVADTSMFAASPDTGEDGNSIMSQNGVELTGAKKDRIPGWNLMRDYIRSGNIRFFSTCFNSIRTIPALIHEDVLKTGNRVEDIARGSEDHAADACRYGLMSLPQAPVKGKEGVFNPYKDDPASPWHEESTQQGSNLYSYNK